MTAYGSDDDFQVWLSSQGLVLPEDAPLPAVLRQIGSDYIDSAYEHALSCSSRAGGYEQDRAWPRKGHRVNGEAVPVDLIPKQWVYASYRAAYLEAGSSGWATTGSDPARLTRREQVDTLAREFFAPGDAAGGSNAAGMPFDAVANSLVTPWLCSATRSPASLFRVV